MFLSMSASGLVFDSPHCRGSSSIDDIFSMKMDSGAPRFVSGVSSLVTDGTSVKEVGSAVQFLQVASPQNERMRGEVEKDQSCCLPFFSLLIFFLFDNSIIILILSMGPLNPFSSEYFNPYFLVINEMKDNVIAKKTKSPEN